MRIMCLMVSNSRYDDDDDDGRCAVTLWLWLNIYQSNTIEGNKGSTSNQILTTKQTALIGKPFINSVLNFPRFVFCISYFHHFQSTSSIPNISNSKSKCMKA